MGKAVASAFATRNPEIDAAVLADAAGQTEPSGIEDAKAAAALMAMNNIYRIPPAQTFCRGHKKTVSPKELTGKMLCWDENGDRFGDRIKESSN